MLMIEECDLFDDLATYNPQNSLNRSSYTLSPVPVQNGGMWVDGPAVFHGLGTNLTFADGHAEFWKWDETSTDIKGFHYVPVANNRDIQRLRKVIGWYYQAPP
jgi:prepilin-type processing-associated H-X9-DG protein